MTEIQNDIDYVKSLLPSSYEVKESKTKGSIHCRSNNGLPSESEWEKFFILLKKRFTGRFQEVFHNTCYNHVDFTIYLRPIKGD